MCVCVKLRQFRGRGCVHFIFRICSWSLLHRLLIILACTLAVGMEPVLSSMSSTRSSNSLYTLLSHPRSCHWNLLCNSLITSFTSPANLSMPPGMWTSTRPDTVCLCCSCSRMLVFPILWMLMFPITRWVMPLGWTWTSYSLTTWWSTGLRYSLVYTDSLYCRVPEHLLLVITVYQQIIVYWPIFEIHRQKMVWR